jgi:hypothetical protein
MSRSLFFLPALSLLTLAAGCGAQADTGTYRGEPLVTLQGAVDTNGITSGLPSSIDAALVWADVKFDTSGQLFQSVTWVGVSTPVTGQFPANFTLSVYQPPPDSVMLACPSSTAREAVGFIYAVASGSDLTSGKQPDVVGEAYDYMILYLDSDEPAGWSCLPNMGFTYAPTKGYHLMQEVPNSKQVRAGGASYPAYVEVPDGLGTSITITLGKVSLPKVPNPKPTPTPTPSTPAPSAPPPTTSK